MKINVNIDSVRELPMPTHPVYMAMVKSIGSGGGNPEYVLEGPYEAEFEYLRTNWEPDELELEMYLEEFAVTV